MPWVQTTLVVASRNEYGCAVFRLEPHERDAGAAACAMLALYAFNEWITAKEAQRWFGLFRPQPLIGNQVPEERSIDQICTALRMRFPTDDWRTVKDPTEIPHVLEECESAQPAVISIREGNQKQYQALCLGFGNDSATHNSLWTPIPDRPKTTPTDTDLLFLDPYFGLVVIDPASWKNSNEPPWYDQSQNSFERAPSIFADITGVCYRER